jgi:hypothetical protein
VIVCGLWLWVMGGLGCLFHGAWFDFLYLWWICGYGLKI